MRKPDFWLFVLLTLGWIALVSSGFTFNVLVSVLPLFAVLILINRIRHRPARVQPSGRIAVPDQAAKARAATS